MVGSEQRCQFSSLPQQPLLWGHGKGAEHGALYSDPWELLLAGPVQGRPQAVLISAGTCVLLKREEVAREDPGL